MNTIQGGIDVHGKWTLGPVLAFFWASFLSFGAGIPLGFWQM